MTDDREDKTLEKQEGFIEVAKSRDVEVLSNRHQFLEFAGNLVPVTKSGDQLSVFFLPFQENRLAFNVKVRQSDSEDAAQAGRIAIMREAKIRAENIPPQHPICTLTITLPEYTGPLPTLRSSPVGAYKEDKRPINVKYSTALAINPADTDVPIEFVARKIGPDWPRLARTLQIPDSDVRQIKRELSSNGGAGQEPLTILKIWIHLKSTEATVDELQQALRKIGRDDIVQKLKNKNELDEEGDSLRLTDTPNLGRSTAFSSKGSLGATTAIAERQPVFNQQPSEPELTETKVVTRTERYVHHAEDGAPVVDERTVTRVFQDNAAVEERVVERQDLPLTEKEQQIWREGPGTPEQKRHLANSREAMIIDGEEQHLGDQVLKTTTLITQHHIIDEPIETGSETAQGIISEPEPETEPDTTQATSLPESQPGEESESGPGIESDPGKWQHFETSGAESEALPPLEETSGAEGDRASPSTVEYQRQQEDVSPPVSVDSVIIRDEEEVVAQPTKAGDSLEHAAEAPPQPRDRRSISPGYEGEGEDTAEEGRFTD
ncbi:death domain-containing protein [Ditylenchus destructor]|nr:death domain-containing protein [Ditylenchus destructor]